MKKQSPVGLFFGILLRAVVVIFGLAIIAFGIFFLSKVIGDGIKSNNGPVTTLPDSVLTDVEGRDDLIYNTAEPDTQEPDTEEPEASPSHDKNILVLNSTNTGGLAGRWCDRLREQGYANVEAADYSDTQTSTRIIAVEDGVGKDLVPYFNGATYEVGIVTQGTNADVSGKDIVIIIGTNDDDGQ